MTNVHIANTGCQTSNKHTSLNSSTLSVQSVYYADFILHNPVSIVLLAFSFAKPKKRLQKS